ncbi:putative membrane protein [Clostridium bornimense]|uniref:Putative membrane protein n=1 Tax=Clostridium bornimense TaxID=1216932 RepID=W6RWK2_9CLOT|nr:DUF2812 domain-containing protein [Clostridium bornimense]CDM69061.1 putative membrane protein [Clostridium bornimense]
MKNKYVGISGLAFNEEEDMKKLSEYAKEGWLLDSIVGGFFYKLRKDTPRNIIYSLDYQDNADEEYFSIFKEAGWELVVSIGNKMNIFSAPAGTKSIYSDLDTEIDKYLLMEYKCKKGVVVSSIIAVILTLSIIVSMAIIRPIFFFLVVLFMADIIVLIFNLMPYLAYKARIKNLNGNSSILSNKNFWKLHLIVGILFIIFTIEGVLKKDYLDLLWLFPSIFSFIECRKYKKCN